MSAGPSVMTDPGSSAWPRGVTCSMFLPSTWKVMKARVAWSLFSPGCCDDLQTVQPLAFKPRECEQRNKPGAAEHLCARRGS